MKKTYSEKTQPHEYFFMVNKVIARSLGLNAAVILAELTYKEPFYTDNGVFYQAHSDIEKSTGLGSKAQRSALKRLSEHNLIEVIYEKGNANFFKLNRDAIEKFCIDQCLEEKDNPCRKDTTTRVAETQPPVSERHTNNNLLIRKEEGEEQIPPTPVASLTEEERDAETEGSLPLASSADKPVISYTEAGVGVSSPRGPDINPLFGGELMSASR